jgi:large subunit ribosomal protein L23
MREMNVWDVLKSPVVTEKSVLLKEESAADESVQQVLTFRVNTKAGKTEMKKAVEEIFSVKVDAVRTINYEGKMKRQGRYVGRRASWKKAYVTLKKGEAQVDYAEAV